MNKPRRPRRPLDGILLLDKPEGMSSNQALQKVRWLFQAEKAGHTGSLDPLATGLLPVCFGEATKFSQHLLDADKVYRARMRLGQKTTTADAEGDIIAERPVPRFTRDEIEAVLQRFRGEITQVPSMFSALKKDGRPLYELARKGIEVERAARAIRIDRLEILQVEPEYWEIEVACSKGTYIRNLVEDIGEALGCGAHVAALRRLATGPFLLSRGGVTLAELEQGLEKGGLEALDRLLLPAWSALTAHPHVALTETQAFYLLRGQPVQVRGLPKTGEEALAFGPEGRFLGLGVVDRDGLLAPRRLLRTQ